jgi:hypothetical protein
VSIHDSPTPDGSPDAVFHATVNGRVSALILTVCDDLGHHSSAHWDTIVGQSPLPAGFMYRVGANTRVLGVVTPDGQLLNNADGTLPLRDFLRPTQLTLFASDSEMLQPGRYICLTALGPDGSAVVSRAELR